MKFLAIIILVSFQVAQGKNISDPCESDNFIKNSWDIIIDQDGDSLKKDYFSIIRVAAIPGFSVEKASWNVMTPQKKIRLTFDRKLARDPFTDKLTGLSILSRIEMLQVHCIEKFHWVFPK